VDRIKGVLYECECCKKRKIKKILVIIKEHLFIEGAFLIRKNKDETEILWRGKFLKI
jgi:hypothetical protein